MCGIAGRFNITGLPSDIGWRSRAIELLAHRGPDGFGEFVDEYCELAHRRLSIIDLSSTGHQPLWNEDHSVGIVYNGELYGFSELRKMLLQRGYTFHGSSDTEVIVYLYEEFGNAMVSYLRGMFAFAIYDRRQRRIVLGRDRFGIKPLYYVSLKDQVVFASEIKALTALSDFCPTIDHQACYDYLGLTYVPEPFTGFNEIKMLPRGHLLVIDGDGQQLFSFAETRVQVRPYETLSQVVDLTADALTKSVEEQRIADVPVAALLSGGIDSSLVVAAYSRYAGETPHTFNVRFPDQQYDETMLAQAVAQRYQTDHFTLDLSDWAITPDNILKLIEHFDQPFADTSLIPTYLVSKAIRDRGFVCTLSGDGGDEAFGGYGRFWYANRLMMMMRLPNWLQSAAILTGEQFTPLTRDWGRQLAKAIRLAKSGKHASSRLIAGFSNYLSEDQKETLVKPSARRELQPVYSHFNQRDSYGEYDLDELSARLTENLFSIGLPGDMLRKVDMMSMLASVEVRVPMLDERLVDIGLSLPHRFKTNGRDGKLVLRALAKRWLPSKVVSHPKHGFSIPIDRMLTPEFLVLLQDLLLSSDARTSNFLEKGQVRLWLQLLKNAGRGQYTGLISRGGVYQRVFIVLALELWMRKYRLTW